MVKKLIKSWFFFQRKDWCISSEEDPTSTVSFLLGFVCYFPAAKHLVIFEVVKEI